MSAARPDWHHDGYPELRAGPPWVMEETLTAQPELARGLLGEPVPGVDAPADAVEGAGPPLTIVGCRTSEHGATAIAALVEAALGHGRTVARPALEAVVAPAAGGVCIGVSHDGGTRATELALEAARAAGAVTALVTAEPGARVTAAADVVVVTPLHDASWCHTVAYTSAVLAGAASPGASASRGSTRRLPTRCCARRARASGTGRDGALRGAPAARGGHRPRRDHRPRTRPQGRRGRPHPDRDARARDPPARPSRRRGRGLGRGPRRVGADARVRRRAELAEAALAELGIPTARLTTSTPSGAGIHPLLHRLLDGAVALQRLTLGLVGARGVNPDLIRREQRPWRAAAAAAEAAGSL